MGVRAMHVFDCVNIIYMYHNYCLAYLSQMCICVRVCTDVMHNDRTSLLNDVLLSAYILHAVFHWRKVAHLDRLFKVPQIGIIIIIILLYQLLAIALYPPSRSMHMGRPMASRHSLLWTTWPSLQSGRQLDTPREGLIPSRHAGIVRTRTRTRTLEDVK